MKKCPTCGRTFHDDYSFCLVDGEVLSAPYSEKTVRMNGPEPAAPTVKMTEPSVETVGPRFEALELPQFLAASDPKPRTSLWIVAVVGVIFAGVAGFVIIGTMARIDRAAQEKGPASRSESNIDPLQGTDTRPLPSFSPPDVSAVNATPVTTPSVSLQPSNADIGSADAQQTPVLQRAGPAPATADMEPAYFLSDVDQPPVITGGREPDYGKLGPAHAEAKVVRLMVLYHRSGRVSQVNVIDDVPGLTVEAVLASYTLVFRPAIKDGTEVSVWAPRDYYFYNY